MTITDILQKILAVLCDIRADVSRQNALLERIAANSDDLKRGSYMSSLSHGRDGESQKPD
jgi:hypothetical protein